MSVPKYSLDPWCGAPVARLTPRDRFVLDPSPIRTLYDTLGEAGAEQVICRALDDIVGRLDRMQQDYRSGDFAWLPAEASKIAAISGQIGLTGVAVACGHLGQALDLMGPGRDAALAATLARLVRSINRAVAEIWTARDRLA